MRALDALRDDEQHWLAEVNEGLLYIHARAAITLFDEILHDVFGERLADHLPGRVLPISTRPLTDIVVLVNEQLEQIQDLLAPGNAVGQRPARCCADCSRWKATYPRRHSSANAT